jgi:hypothetical protein
VPPASDSAPKTQDTSGRLSQPELLQCDQVPAFLKTSKDIAALGFPTCCKTWQEWVTERRGAWRQRVNAARLTRGRGSLSWPTATAFDFNNTPLNRIDGTGKTYKSNLKEAVHQNWPTVCASEVRQGFQDRSRGMKGSQESLTTAVILHGQAAPASSSSLGSRQGLWLTPRANEPDSDPNFAARNADRGAHCHGTLSSQAKAEQWPTPEASQGGRQGGSFSQQSWKNADGLPRQMSLAQATKMWPTITAHTPDMESNGPNGHQGTYLAGAVKQQEQWSTPTMPVGGRKCRSGKRKGELLLDGQAKRWGTPTARDHKSGRGNEDRQYKELTPMVERQQSGKLNPRWVETLMGLPIGWTMPSCTSPQTIAPMSCDSSAMESCLPPQSELSEFSLAS